jgi:hypothetical protein
MILAFGQAEHAGHVEVVLRHALHALGGVEDHGPDRADEDGPGRRRVGLLEHQQADRQPGQRRDRAQQADDGLEHAFMKAKRPMMKPSGMPTSRGKPKPMPTRLQ